MHVEYWVELAVNVDYWVELAVPVDYWVELAVPVDDGVEHGVYDGENLHTRRCKKKILLKY